MNNYDIIVIGGGISGLNVTYQLLKKNNKLKIALFEKNDYLGGRIYTHKENDFYFEAGAGRFNDNHILLNSLIKELKLETLKTPIKSAISFVPSNKYHEKYNFTNPFDILKPVFSELKKSSRKILQKKSFIESCKDILNKEEIKYIIDSFGYYEQLMFMNSYDALHLFNNGMNTKNQFYTLKGGMSTIIDRLLEKIEKKCYIEKKSEIQHVKINDGHEYEIKVKNILYTCKHCIFAIPKPSLEKFKIFKPIGNKLSSIKIKPLCRIYAQFKEKGLWINDIEKTTTNNENRYIIPINRKIGLSMISYSDGKFARFWNSLSKHSMIKQIRENIFKTFGEKIPVPNYIKKCYWDIGTAYWLPNYDSTILIPEIMKPFDNEHIYICGENYSRSQGWIEGALETSNSIVYLIK